MKRSVHRVRQYMQTRLGGPAAGRPDGEREALLALALVPGLVHRLERALHGGLAGEEAGDAVRERGEDVRVRPGRLVRLVGVARRLNGGLPIG